MRKSNNSLKDCFENVNITKCTNFTGVQWFERFRSASGLAEKDQSIQINSLIYCMGNEADDILDSLTLTNDEKKVYLQ